MAAMQPVRTSAQALAPKARPDARPMRMALGAGGIAALSALAAAIVLPPRSAAPVSAVPVSATQGQQTQALDQASPTPIQVVRPIIYVQLSPGQTAPPGATVIPASAPTPITVVVNVPAPARPKAAAGQAAATPVIIKTTQSGTVVP
jgi:hypothetical protein